MTSRQRGVAWILGAMLGAVAYGPVSARSTDQQRDAPAAATAGTAEISGVVATTGDNPSPLRHAIVTVRGDGSATQSTVTDDAGRFVIQGLPSGRYVVSAAKPAYLPIAYGAKRPGNPGTPLSVAEGQHVDVSIAMSRGGVISGVITDPSGVPLEGAAIAAVDLSGAQQSLLTSAPFVKTDDRGTYRLYGLAPGEYAVVVVPRLSGSGAMYAPWVEQVDATRGELARRPEMRVRQPGTTRDDPALPVPQSAGVAPVYFPGTPNLSEATRVTLAEGDERGEVSFPANIVRLSTISGTVTGAAPVSLSIIPDAPRPPFQMSISTPVLTSAPNADGRFQYTNVAPGRYRIVARSGAGAAVPTGATSVGASGGSGNRPPEESGTPRPYSFGVADVDVGSDQQASVSLTMLPGSVFAGRIRFDGKQLPVPEDLSTIRVQLGLPAGTYSSSSNSTTIGNAISSVAPVLARPDGTFELGGISPGRFNLTVTLPPAAGSGWWLRSATSKGKDLLDEPPDFVPGQDMTDVVITFTDRHTQLSGSLRTADGQPAPEHFVVVFSQDRSAWRAGSRRVKLVRPGSDGTFSIMDLPAGEYWIVALGDVNGNEWQRADFLDKIAPAGVAVTLGEGERKVQDLRIK
jgi:uncharacterized protein (DUF2141 family)